MENCSNDFIINQNKIAFIPESKYAELEGYINTAKKFDEITFIAAYLFDFYKHQCLYASRKTKFICGLSPEEIMKLGYSFIDKYVPMSDQKKLIEFNKVTFNFIDTKLDPEERNHFFTMCDFYINNGNYFSLVHQKFSPLVLSDDGKVWIALSLLNLSSQKVSGNMELHIEGGKSFWKYSLVDHQWTELPYNRLTFQESRVLQLSIKGMTTGDIAKNMHLSKDTVKFHKHNIFMKCGTNNIVGAYAYTMAHQLLI